MGGSACTRIHATCTVARARLYAYAVVMYKVLRVNGQQTGREPRINERNFGTCGMPADAPRFIRIQACSLVHASSSVVFTRVSRLSFLFATKSERGRNGEREREGGGRGKGRGGEKVETGTGYIESAK